MIRPKDKPLILRDEIHGDIAFAGAVRRVIDHECFQRLRYIRQLGLAEYVFPCATHSRFQHSLGAAFLAGEYFDSMLNHWLDFPFQFDEKAEGTTFLSRETIQCVKAVASDPTSKTYWRQVVELAGLLHDIGHGPWSHTFETLDLAQKFDEIICQLEGSIGHYFDDLNKHHKKFRHEEISVIYIFTILKDLEQQQVIKSTSHYFLPVAMLVNRSMADGKFKQEMERDLKDVLTNLAISGGVNFHKLLKPIISGPFDVDRIDYIQRDGRNCGVHIGGIEWRRIVNKLIPCLAHHPNQNHEPTDVVLLSNIKNQHVLDDFIFSLFQMYAQVYLHPKIVGLEEIIKRVLNKKLGERKPEVTFRLHQSFTDEQFRRWLREECKIEEINRILLRQPDSTFQVASYPDDSGREQDLAKNRFSRVETQDRPMMKDKIGVFLFSTFKEKDHEDHFLKSWAQISPIAHQFYLINYSPKIWIRSNVFTVDARD